MFGLGHRLPRRSKNQSESEHMNGNMPEVCLHVSCLGFFACIFDYIGWMIGLINCDVKK